LGVLDVRVYRSELGRRGQLVELMRSGTVPLLREAGIGVVAYGASLHDEEHSYLIRQFASVKERDDKLMAFYSSEAWLSEWEPKIMGLITSYEVAVIPAPIASA
jgi:hypothetical protein